MFDIKKKMENIISELEDLLQINRLETKISVVSMILDITIPRCTTLKEVENCLKDYVDGRKRELEYKKGMLK